MVNTGISTLRNKKVADCRMMMRTQALSLFFASVLCIKIEKNYP